MAGEKTVKILMSNLSYARGTNGMLHNHLRYAHRLIYCSPSVQEKVLSQLAHIMAAHDPDICCFAEIDRGSFSSANLNQLDTLIGPRYHCFDIENKYGPESLLRSFFLTSGKSNAFIAKAALPFTKHYFTVGSKRLVYAIDLREDVTLYFAHFSLSYGVRRRQLREVRAMIRRRRGHSMLLGDFNILTGFAELAPLLKGTDLQVLNNENEPTFVFSRLRMALDLCICSRELAGRAHLQVIPQAYSDHAALLVEVALP